MQAVAVWTSELVAYAMQCNAMQCNASLGETRLRGRVFQRRGTRLESFSHSDIGIYPAGVGWIWIRGFDFATLAVSNHTEHQRMFLDAVQEESDEEENPNKKESSAMKCSILCVGVISVCSLFLYTDDKSCPPNGHTPAPPVISIAELKPQLHQQEVTIRFTVSELGGVSQLAIPGKAPSFIIEAESDHQKKDFSLWIEGELADVLDRLQLSISGTDPIKNGTIVVATGSLEYSPGVGDRAGHEWYSLTVEKWQNFRIVAPNVSSEQTVKPTE